MVASRRDLPEVPPGPECANQNAKSIQGTNDLNQHYAFCYLLMQMRTNENMRLQTSFWRSEFITRISAGLSPATSVSSLGFIGP